MEITTTERGNRKNDDKKSVGKIIVIILTLLKTCILIIFFQNFPDKCQKHPFIPTSGMLRETTLIVSISKSVIRSSGLCCTKKSEFQELQLLYQYFHAMFANLHEILRKCLILQQKKYILTCVIILKVYAGHAALPTKKKKEEKKRMC